MSRELRFLLEKVSSYQNGIFTINKSLLISKYGVKEAEYLEYGIREIYRRAYPIKSRRRVKRDLVTCVIKELISDLRKELGWVIYFYELVNNEDFINAVREKLWDKVVD